MRAVLIAVATLLAVPALAQNSKMEPPAKAEAFRPPPGSSSPGTPGAPSPGPHRALPWWWIATR